MDDVFRFLTDSLFLVTSSGGNVSIAVNANNSVHKRHALYDYADFQDIQLTTTTNSPDIPIIKLCDCVRMSDCCSPNSVASLSVTIGLIIFISILMGVCCWKYCIQHRKSYSKLEESESEPLLRDAPPQFASPGPCTSPFPHRSQPQPQPPPYYNPIGAPHDSLNFFYSNEKAKNGEKIPLIHKF